MDKFNIEDKISYTEFSGILQRNIDEIKASMEKLWGSKYDSEKLRDEKSFSIFEEEITEKFDNLKKELNEAINYLKQVITPIGAIIPFAGTIAQLKEILDTGEYYICDGTKGTPNLIGKYIRGGGLMT